MIKLYSLLAGYKFFAYRIFFQYIVLPDAAGLIFRGFRGIFFLATANNQAITNVDENRYDDNSDWAHVIYPLSIYLN